MARLAPNINPGTIPAMKSFTTDTPAIAPYRMKAKLGGIMIAIEAEDEVIAAANPTG